MDHIYTRVMYCVARYAALTAAQKTGKLPIDFMDEADAIVRRATMVAHPLQEPADVT